MFYFNKYFLCFVCFFSKHRRSYSHCRAAVYKTPLKSYVENKHEWNVMVKCIFWVKRQLSKSHVQQGSLANQQHIISVRAMTFGIQSTLMNFTLSHLQLLQTSQYSANMLLMLSGKHGSHQPFSALIELGNLGAHIFPFN